MPANVATIGGSVQGLDDVCARLRGFQSDHAVTTAWKQLPHAAVAMESERQCSSRLIEELLHLAKETQDCCAQHSSSSSLPIRTSSSINMESAFPASAGLTGVEAASVAAEVRQKLKEEVDAQELLRDEYARRLMEQRIHEHSDGHGVSELLEQLENAKRVLVVETQELQAQCAAEDTLIDQMRVRISACKAKAAEQDDTNMQTERSRSRDRGGFGGSAGHGACDNGRCTLTAAGLETRRGVHDFPLPEPSYEEERIIDDFLDQIGRHPESPSFAAVKKVDPPHDYLSGSSHGSAEPGRTCGGLESFSGAQLVGPWRPGHSLCVGLGRLAPLPMQSRPTDAATQSMAPPLLAPESSRTLSDFLEPCAPEALPRRRAAADSGIGTAPSAVPSQHKGRADPVEAASLHVADVCCATLPPSQPSATVRDGDSQGVVLHQTEGRAAPGEAVSMHVADVCCAALPPSQSTATARDGDSRGSDVAGEAELSRRNEDTAEGEAQVGYGIEPASNGRLEAMEIIEAARRRASAAASPSMSSPQPRQAATAALPPASAAVVHEHKGCAREPRKPNGGSAEPYVPLAGPRLRLDSSKTAANANGSGGAVLLRWCAHGDSSHFLASRVELQVWHVAGPELEHLLKKRGLNCLFDVGSLENPSQELNGCKLFVVDSHAFNLDSENIRAQSHDDQTVEASSSTYGLLHLHCAGDADVAGTGTDCLFVAGPGDDAGGGAIIGTNGAPAIACRLLRQRQVPAHVGSARAPAPIVVEGLEPLLLQQSKPPVAAASAPVTPAADKGGSRADASTACAIAIRARLYGSGAARGCGVSQHFSRHRCAGSWGPPLLLLLWKSPSSQLHVAGTAVSVGNLLQAALGSSSSEFSEQAANSIQIKACQ